MSTAVLLSGGLDSAVLLADEAASGDVHPLYVSVGLAWEAAEQATLSIFLASHALGSRVHPVESLGVDMRDVYGLTHWAVRGQPPACHTPEEDVYLAGRNVILLAKASIYCAAAKIVRLLFPVAQFQFRIDRLSAVKLARRVLPARTHQCSPWSDTVTLPSLLTGKPA